VHKKKDFVRARSQCPHCGHELAPADLVPVISYLRLRGRCRYCKKTISAQYPVVELVGGLAFVASYIFWPSDLHAGGNIVLLLTWLVTSVGLLALAVYDLKWMLLPNKIIYPTLAAAAAGQAVYLIGFASNKSAFLVNWLASIVVASGFFWLLYMISDGKWIGYGDVRLGLITGTILHSPDLSALMIFLASLLGTIASLPLLLTGKKKLTEKLPFGPFLVLSTFICLLFGQSLIDWYKSAFLP
jgi:prepilin signal peptidase PulO-like enzyme (type II secretory pathway)